MAAVKNVNPYRSANGRFSHNFKDLTGQRFNRWVILSRAENYRGKYSAWLCRCDCGTERVVKAVNLKTNTSQSCGCYAREVWKRTLGRENPKRQKNTPDSLLNGVFLTYQWQAKRKNREFTLSKQDFLTITAKNCYYCGALPSNQAGRYGRMCRYNGMDRVDNLKGYTLDNVVPCCKTCNAMKQDFTSDVFLDTVVRIYHHTFLSKKASAA